MLIRSYKDICAGLTEKEHTEIGKESHKTLMEITEQDESGITLKINNPCSSRRRSRANDSGGGDRRRRHSSVNDWYPIALALFGVGVGLAYAFR